MARKAKDNPTNMGDTDVANELRAASSQLVNAQEALEAAREPVRGAKAIVKAAGIDFDIFKLCHGIRHLDDDDARQKRIRKLQVAIAALLSDKVQLDLFGFMVAQVKPAVKEALREASDTLQREEPEATTEPQDTDLPFDPPSVPEVEEPSEDVPALVAAESMPEGAGFAFNNGMQAGRQGFDADANPHEPGSAEAVLWEDGRAKGLSVGPAEVAEEPAAAVDQPGVTTVVEFAGTAEQRRIQAYFYGFDNASKNPINALTKGRRGEIKARIEAGFRDASEGVEPRHPRPTTPERGAVASQPTTDADESGEAETDPARVGVRDIDGKPTLFDLLANSPLVDVSSARTGEAWALQINEYFADRLNSVSRAELIDAAKTLSRGRMLVTPTAPGSAPAYDLRSAV